MSGSLCILLPHLLPWELELWLLSMFLWMHAACCTGEWQQPAAAGSGHAHHGNLRDTEVGEQRWCTRGQVEHGLPPLVSHLCLRRQPWELLSMATAKMLSEEELTWLCLSISNTYNLNRFWADCSCLCLCAYDFTCLSQTPFQSSGLDTSRTTRHHGLVDRVYRDRNRLGSPHRRPLSVDKHGRQISFGSRLTANTDLLNNITAFWFSSSLLPPLLAHQWGSFPSPHSSELSSSLSTPTIL